MTMRSVEVRPVGGVAPVCDESGCDAEVATRVDCCDYFLCLKHIVQHNVDVHRYHDERRRRQRRAEIRGGRRAADLLASDDDEFATAI